MTEIKQENQFKINSLCDEKMNLNNTQDNIQSYKHIFTKYYKYYTHDVTSLPHNLEKYNTIKQLIYDKIKQIQ